MRIEIDTAHDSPEDIQKAIQLLQSLSGKRVYTSQPRNAFENPLPENPYPGTPASPFPQPSPAQSAFGTLFESMEKTEKKEETLPDKVDLEMY